MEQVRRRLFLFATGALLAAPLAVKAQQVEKVHRVSFFSGPTPSPAMIDAFRQGLRENGYVEGRNVRIDWHSAEGKDERLPGLAAELVKLKAEVVVTFASGATLAAQKATATIPIVFTQVGDPVGVGIVASLARPGANVTGLTNVTGDLARKRLELIKEAVPALRSVALLMDLANPTNNTTSRETEIAAGKLRLDVRTVVAGQLSGLEPAFRTIAQARARAVVLAPGAFIFTQRMQIINLATKARIPVVGWDGELADSGALISYGPNRFEMLRHAGVYVDKILKGAKPSDLPVEEPTKFELVLNLKVAKALDLKISQSILQRADRVIE